MNLSFTEAVEYVKVLRNKLNGSGKTLCGICPSYVFLKEVCDSLKGSGVSVVAQNIHSEIRGAYTGEVSAAMIKEVGCSYTLIGHSERRHVFGETDSFVNAKMKTAFSVDLTPILCIGEKLDERTDGKTESVVRQQLKEGLREIGIDQIKKLVIAYEPVWAIGTGKTASPEQANEVHLFIRNTIKKDYGETIANDLYILYGGSVNPDNARELMMQPEVNGLLVGGASLKVESFVEIIDRAKNQ
ncbi:MAG: triose-phosphate isomerase [Candidatus Brocadiaceae bacterium]|nr:triose-phosphate isomerase [Candidatus Brocadiaceae bacterium]